MLNLVQFKGFDKECHVIAAILAIVSGVLIKSVIPMAGTTSAVTTGVICGVCWYVFKLGDGLTYDGRETPLGTIAALAIIAIIATLHFLTIWN